MQSFTHALYHLAANPEFADILREEVEEVVRNEGCTKAAMGKMRKLDSFMRESQRYNGISSSESLSLWQEQFELMLLRRGSLLHSNGDAEPQVLRWDVHPEGHRHGCRHARNAHG